MLDALATVQATPEELNSLVSIASVQTKGLKRHFYEQNFPEKVAAKKIPKSDQDLLNGDAKINAIKGAKHLRNALKQDDTAKNDPNVVGFDESSSESSSEDDIEEENDINKVIEEENDINKEIKVENVKIEPEYDEPLVKKQKIETIIIKDDDKQPKNQKATFVQVIRDESIQIARLKLPILAEEQQIMETINENSIIIIAGETGSGKTTQVPQFLYEAGYALNGQIIAVTEPRRVAAISMSQRVGEEMSLPNEVGYLIRFEGNVTDETKIKFMTDGVLLKEVQNDFLLKKYSVIILDEAHERSVYTDILLGLLSRIVPLRNKKGLPLKLIIMSATLRVEDFTQNDRLFKTIPPVLKVEARQFPVTVHFNKRTHENYLKEAYNKAAKVHCRLPDGGILIFVTGQQEVKLLVRKLRGAFPMKNKNKIIEAQKSLGNNKHKKIKEYNDQFNKPSQKKEKHKKMKILPKINLDDYSLPQDHDEDNDEEDDNIQDDLLSDTDENEATTLTSDQPLWVLPLYSLLPTHKQSMVFQPPPMGCRLCVVSTNVAETSLTIPGIKYVIDTGKTKVKLFDKTTGVTSYIVHWTSQASADQRAGRAGRTAPGHCYRLYSSAVFNDTFEKFTKPEIQEKPVDDLYLQMKCMNIDKVVNFPFPTAPDLLQLRVAANRLEVLGALKDGSVTDLGRAIAKFPVLPRYGKMLALSHQHDLLPYTVLLVAALSVQEVLMETPINDKFDIKETRKKWHATRVLWAGSGHAQLLGDPMVLLKAVGAAEYAHQKGSLESFCMENGLRHKAIIEIRKLRHQLTNEIKINVPDVDLCVDFNMKPPTDLQAKLLRQIILSGMGDQVARKIPLDEIKENQDKVKFKYAYHAMNMEEPVWLHQGSVLKKTLPEFVVYQEIYETNKMYMRGVTAIDPEWLVRFVPHSCNLSEPLSDPEPSFNESTGVVNCTVRGSFGSQNWELPNCVIDYKHTLGAYRWFARFLLEGRVFYKLEKYKKCLLSTPSTMVKSWANLQERTDCLLKGLMAAKVSSRGEMEDVWEEQPKCKYFFYAVVWV